MVDFLIVAATFLTGITVYGIFKTAREKKINE